MMDNVDSAAGPVPVLPGYSVSRLLGQGGQSSVWLATRDSDGARFAVKYSGSPGGLDRPGSLGGPGEWTGNAPGAAGTAVDLDAALGEVRLLYRIRHEHLVRIHDVFEPGGRPEEALAIVMDYAAGGSLANLVFSRGKLTVGETVTVLVPIAQVLAFLHGQGIVHGDVSPGNVLITASGKPLLADLGMARVLGGAERDPDVGTAGFIDTPQSRRHGEQETSRGKPDGGELHPHRDVYSLAAVAWFCLTGRSPEPTSGRPPLSLLVPGVPKALAAVLENGLSDVPRARPVAREFATAVFRCAAAEPLDLSGVVHPSVIPELVTRRQTTARSDPILRKLSRLFLRSAGASRFWRTRRARGMHRLQTKRGWHRLRGSRVTMGLLVAAMLTVGSAVWALGPKGQAPSREAEVIAVGTGGVAEPAGTGLPEPSNIPDWLNTGLRSEDPAIAAHALAGVRDLAFSQQRPELLGLVNAPGSAAHAADSTLAAQLVHDGTRLTGLSTAITDTAVVGTPGAAEAVVALTMSVSGYQERTASGVLVRAQAAGAPQRLQLHLVRPDGRWQVSDVWDSVSGG